MLKRRLLPGKHTTAVPLRLERMEVEESSVAPCPSVCVSLHFPSAAAAATSAPMTAHRAAVLAAWRDFLELLHRLPPSTAASRRADAAARIRAAASTPPDSPTASDGLKQLLAAIAGLRATTARVPGERRSGRGGVYVLRRGELVDGEGGGASR